MERERGGQLAQPSVGRTLRSAKAGHLQRPPQTTLASPATQGLQGRGRCPLGPRGCSEQVRPLPSSLLPAESPAGPSACSPGWSSELLCPRGSAGCPALEAGFPPAHRRQARGTLGRKGEHGRWRRDGRWQMFPKSTCTSPSLPSAQFTGSHKPYLTTPRPWLCAGANRLAD